jgi:propanol-preferring alcohol dehydrogenase
MSPEVVHGWAVERPDPDPRRALAEVERPRPEPGQRQLLVEVAACGVCRTDLHLAQGDLQPHRPRTIPGHEVVGRVSGVGPEVRRTKVGDRVGIAWLRGTCGECRYCRGGAENLCPSSTYTGWDTDGGYADWAVVDEDYSYRIPDAFDDEHAAPLLCAGIIGYRALRRAQLPPGGRLGIYGFGASAHLAAQLALWEGARLHVLTRSAEAQRLALDLGAASAGEADASPPEPLDAAILFAPVGDLVPVALAALDRGGTLSIAGIHLTDVPVLNYEQHLFYERTVRSVTANTREDGHQFLELAARAGITVTTTPYPMREAPAALADLAADRVRGAAVLVTGHPG